jgi:hypothetical protein
MSIISAVLLPNVFTIVTDTLEALPNVNNAPPSEDCLTGMKSKIFHHPHIKCSTVVLGLSRIANMHATFVSENFITDSTDLYELTINKFIPGLDLDSFKTAPDNPTVFSMYIFGCCEAEGALVAYHIGVIKGRSVIHKKFDCNPQTNKSGLVDVMFPPLSKADNKKIIDSLGKDPAKINFSEYAITCAKKAHANYVSHENDNQNIIPVGGELHQTIIGIVNGNYMTSTITAYKFPDYNENVERIKAYLNNQSEALDRYKAIEEWGAGIDEFLEKQKKSH